MTEIELLPEVDYYEVLQVSVNAEQDVIQAAYSRLVDKWQAQRQPGDHAAFDQLAILDRAITLLSDTTKRKEYDDLRRETNTSGVADESVSTKSTIETSRRTSAIKLLGVPLIVTVVSAFGFWAVLRDKPEPRSTPPTSHAADAWLAANKEAGATKSANQDPKGDSTARPLLTADELFVRVSPSVVQVVVLDREGERFGSGSGFVIGTDGMIATNYHVIERANSVLIVFSDGTKLTVMGVAALDKEADLAILKVTQMVKPQPLELASNVMPQVGTKVYAIGNPLRLSNTLSDGLVSGHREIERTTVIQTTAPISPGSSGGPLFGSDGRVIGVTSSGLKGGQNINFAVPVSHLIGLLPRPEKDAQLTRFPLMRQSDAEDYIIRGEAAAEKKEYDQAIKQFDEAIRLEPHNSEAFCGRAWAWYVQFKLVNALRDFDESIRLKSINKRAYSGRGVVNYHLQYYDKSISDFDEAIRLDPKDGYMYRLRGSSWSGKEDYENAQRDFDEAIRLDPNDGDAFRDRGHNWKRKKDYAKAINDFEKSINLEPQTGLGITSGDLAWLLATCPEGKYRDGKRSVEIATKICEFHRWSFFVFLETLAAAHAEKNQFDLAVLYQTKALDDPQLRGTLREDSEQRLELYKKQKPFRDYR